MPGPKRRIDLLRRSRTANRHPLVRHGDGPRRHLFGARCNRYRCSLPGLAGLAAYRREETDASRHRTGDSTAKVNPRRAEPRLSVEAGRQYSRRKLAVDR